MSGNEPGTGLRVGIIGCGDAARRVHLPKLEAAGAQVIRFASKHLADAEAAAEQSTAEAMATDDWHKVVASPHIDAVDICTPNHLHAEMALAALEAGKHVLVESPMALDVREADQLLKAAARKGKMLVPAHSVRFIGPYAALADAARSGAIGAISHARVEFGHHGPDRLYPHADWYLDHARAGGGALVDLGIAITDLLRVATDSEVVEVVAAVGGQRGDVETRGEARLRFASGATADIVASWEGPANLLEVTGSDGTLRLDPKGPPRLVRPDGTDAPVGLAGAPHADIEAVFVDAVTGGTPTVNALDGRAAVAVVAAAYQSAETGQPVEVSAPSW
jgi:UDP-N-acetylglucosamine 3-dehydrogenase